MNVNASELEIRPFDALYASTIAGWVRDEAELYWLAPTTVPPLSAAKVVGWTGPTDCPLLLFQAGRPLPCGYAELNPLKGASGQLWMGHVVIEPALRKRGLGRRFTRMLIERAFEDPKIERVVLIVFPDNTAALRCYHATGFETVGDERHRFRRGCPVTRMHRLEILRRGYEELPRDRMGQ